MHLRNSLKLNRPLLYTPQAVSEAQLPSYTLRGHPRQLASFSTWMCGEESGRDSPPVTRFGPKHLGTKGLQKEVPAGSCSPGGLSLQGVTPLAMEDPQEAKSSHQHLGVHTDSDSDSDTIGQRKARNMKLPKGPAAPPLLCPDRGPPRVPPLQTPSLPCSPTDEGPARGLLESLVCPSDEDPASKTEAESPGLQAPDLESPTELDSLSPRPGPNRAVGES